jgi:hypothetical protein
MHLHTVYMYMGYSDVSECLSTHLTPLAERTCFSQAARVLLDGGADPNLADSDGVSPLIWAALTGQLDVLRLLLERGAARDNSDCHFRKPTTEYDRKPGVKRLSCTAK